jgi:hypothetical protein
MKPISRWRRGWCCLWKIRSGAKRHRLGFVDIGCAVDSVNWLRGRGVRVISPSPDACDGLMGTVAGYHQSQICRPFLPKLFPDIDCFVWLDSDVWVQSGDTVKSLAVYATRDRDKLFICPECHYAYTTLNSDLFKFHINNVRLFFRAAYDEQIAATMSAKPTLNTGVFAMSADNPLWALWAEEVKSLYGRDYPSNGDYIRHVAEQMALNYVAHRTGAAVPVDPIYNFMCIWALPFRDEAGIVRVPLPPYGPIGIVHLSLWKLRRNFYFEHGLLFQEGRYLTDEERKRLQS